VEFLKLQKDYNFNKTMILETTKFMVSKHLIAFKTKVFSKTMVFFQYFENTLYPNRALTNSLIPSQRGLVKLVRGSSVQLF
jgi:hypothetical protein